MATKAQLKQRCKELEEMLENAENQRDSYAELASSRQNHIDNLKLVVERDKEWGLKHEKREMFLEKCMKQIAYIAAHDTVEQGTHRQRNEKWRHITRMIALWLNTKHEYMGDMEEIPF